MKEWESYFTGHFGGVNNMLRNVQCLVKEDFVIVAPNSHNPRGFCTGFQTVQEISSVSEPIVVVTLAIHQMFLFLPFRAYKRIAFPCSSLKMGCLCVLGILCLPIRYFPYLFLLCSMLQRVDPCELHVPGALTILSPFTLQIRVSCPLF